MKDVPYVSYAEYEQLVKNQTEQSDLLLQLQAQLQALMPLCTALAATHPNPAELCEKYMGAMDCFADTAHPSYVEICQPAMQEQLKGLIHIRNAKEH